ncbi:hypothetical protein ACLOJK_000943 [Asimina triloba]
MMPHTRRLLHRSQLRPAAATIIDPIFPESGQQLHPIQPALTLHPSAEQCLRPTPSIQLLHHDIAPASSAHTQRPRTIQQQLDPITPKS